MSKETETTTNSRVGRTYPKCEKNKLCKEEYLCGNASRCEKCKKVTA